LLNGKPFRGTFVPFGTKKCTLERTTATFGIAFEQAQDTHQGPRFAPILVKYREMRERYGLLRARMFLTPADGQNNVTVRPENSVPHETNASTSSCLAVWELYFQFAALILSGTAGPLIDVLTLSTR
jgi:hypothetical protein